jgi:hypothetical protein
MLRQKIYKIGSIIILRLVLAVAAGIPWSIKIDKSVRSQLTFKNGLIRNDAIRVI